MFTVRGEIDKIDGWAVLNAAVSGETGAYETAGRRAVSDWCKAADMALFSSSDGSG